MKYTIFGTELTIPARTFNTYVTDMRRSDQIAKAADGKSETELLKMLAVEKATKNRVFVLERLYIKFKKSRERREKVEIITS